MANLLDRAQRALLAWQGFTSFHLTTSVGRLHVLEKRSRGELPTLVFLHGFSASSMMYGPLMRRLEPESRRILAIDLPGHGLSEVPSRGLDYLSMKNGMFEALDRLLAWNAPAVLIGNSMGGFAAVRYAVHRPERVRALVLISPGGAPMSKEGFASFLDTFRLRSQEDALDFIDKLFARPQRLRRIIARAVLKRPPERGVGRVDRCDATLGPAHPSRGPDPDFAGVVRMGRLGSDPPEGEP
ncbi:MAG: alpha/beta fold hydrolase [Myxococcales bacterium]|nr:alpha/beta fold hydrolase [Myxococcales bacterium]